MGRDSRYRAAGHEKRRRRPVTIHRESKLPQEERHPRGTSADPEVRDALRCRQLWFGRHLSIRDIARITGRDEDWIRAAVQGRICGYLETFDG